MMRNSDRAGRAPEIPERDQKQLRPDTSTRSGGSNEAEGATRVETKKRMEIRSVKGRLEVVETE
jgi:hypothetical protein